MEGLTVLFCNLPERAIKTGGKLGTVAHHSNLTKEKLKVIIHEFI